MSLEVRWDSWLVGAMVIDRQVFDGVYGAFCTRSLE